MNKKERALWTIWQKVETEGGIRSLSPYLEEKDLGGRKLRRKTYGLGRDQLKVALLNKKVIKRASYEVQGGIKELKNRG